VAEIVTACGLDPATATAEDMDRLDARFGCPSCTEVRDTEPDAARIICFGWREALLHQNVAHHDHGKIDWVMLGAAALNVALEFEKELAEYSTGEDAENALLDPPSCLVVWMCAHCLDLPSQKAPQELYSIKDHIRSSHNIINPQPEIDYYKDFEDPQGYYTDMPTKISILKVEIPKIQDKT